jgi:hypothetical protein
MSSATVEVGSTLAAGADTADASAGSAVVLAAALAGTGAEEAAGDVEAEAGSALAFFSFLAGAATTAAATATGAGAGAVDCCSATVLGGADSFFATRLTGATVGLAELIVLVPVEMFDMFKRTGLPYCVFFESKFLSDSNYFSVQESSDSDYSRVTRVSSRYNSKYVINILEILFFFIEVLYKIGHFHKNYTF